MSFQQPVVSFISISATKAFDVQLTAQLDSDNRIPSVIMVELPTGFGYTGNISLKSQFSKTNSANPEFPHIPSRSAATETPVVVPYLKFLLSFLFYNE